MILFPIISIVVGLLLAFWLHKTGYRPCIFEFLEEMAEREEEEEKIRTYILNKIKKEKKK